MTLCITIPFMIPFLFSLLIPVMFFIPFHLPDAYYCPYYCPHYRPSYSSTAWSHPCAYFLVRQVRQWAKLLRRRSVIVFEFISSNILVDFMPSLLLAEKFPIKLISWTNILIFCSSKYIFSKNCIAEIISVTANYRLQDCTGTRVWLLVN